MTFSGRDAVCNFQESGYRFLPVDVDHALAVESLTTHHQDPFDRILIAQVLVEPMRLMTHDPLAASCSDTIIEI
jgi:PIN domain nuclease of toxin-antitoxin system